MLNKPFVGFVLMLGLTACNKEPIAHPKTSTDSATKTVPTPMQEERIGKITFDDSSVKSLGSRISFGNLLRIFMMNSSDDYSGPTVNDAWQGIGIDWHGTEPADSPGNDNPFRNVGELGKWEKAALVRVQVGNAFAASANQSVSEEPWRIEAYSSSKWVDAVVFKPLADCYTLENVRCRDKETGEDADFDFIPALKTDGFMVKDVKCSGETTITTETGAWVSLFRLETQEKKPIYGYEYTTHGASYSSSRFGILFDAESVDKACGTNFDSLNSDG